MHWTDYLGARALSDIATPAKLPMSHTEALLLQAVMTSGEPQTGAALHAGTGVPRGTLYATLARMEDAGILESVFIAARKQPGGRAPAPRRHYRITTRGTEALDAYRAMSHISQWLEERQR